jgi:hypothetical protein
MFHTYTHQNGSNTSSPSQPSSPIKNFPPGKDTQKLFIGAIKSITTEGINYQLQPQTLNRKLERLFAAVWQSI